MTDDYRYFVCEGCAHYWASPYFPDRCENCGSGSLEVLSIVDIVDFAEVRPSSTGRRGDLTR